MAMDFTPWEELPMDELKRLFLSKMLQWQPLLPNQYTSQSIKPNKFFGRAMYLPIQPYARVIVISGCTDKDNTSKACSEVQEWHLDDMTVRLAEPLVPARTSFNAIRHPGSRHIYVIGGNHKKQETLKDTKRFDIYSLRWEDLPELNFARANCASVIID